jgi:hypothetical protein
MRQALMMRAGSSSEKGVEIVAGAEGEELIEAMVLHIAAVIEAMEAPSRQIH